MATAARQEFRDPVSHDKYLLYRCSACEVEFWTPLVMPPPSYYEDAVGEYVHYHRGDVQTLSWWHRAVLTHMPEEGAGRRMLDIGCADGRFLRAMQARGWQVAGLDFDRASVAAARRNCPDGDILHASLEEALHHFPPHTFDLVTFFEVLEHQADPAVFIGQVKSLLRPGGRIAGSVPNRDRYVFPARYSPDLPPHHFTLWNGRVLQAFLERHDFENVRTVITRYEPVLLDQLVRHLAGRRVDTLKARMGVRSFEAADYDSPSNRTAKRITRLKHVVWNPLMKLLTMPEYPLLWLSGRGISLCFLARLGNDER